jgi:glycosyltransferase involved in cell wall biosynthesis
MKVLYLAPDSVPAPKGAGIRIARTVLSMQRAGYEVEVFTPSPVGPERLGGQIPGITHETVDLPHVNFLERMLAYRRAVAAWLAERDADLIQFRSIWEGIPALAWAREHSVPVVYEAHGFPSIELVYHFPGLQRSPGMIEKLIREEAVVLGAASLIITPSRTGARYLQMRAVPPTRIALVPNCVDPGVFAASTPPPNVPPYRIVYQGTLAPWQGLESLLEALTPLRHEPLELHVVGPARSAWRRSLRVAARRSRVHHLLHLSRATAQTELIPVLATAHVCAAPLAADARNAAQGCCPIKLLEYMAMGRPILSTAIAAVEELVTHAESAWLVTPGSPRALAEGIQWMLKHPDERESLGRSARARSRAFGVDCFEGDLTRALERALD